LQGLDRFLIPIGYHDTSPFSIKRVTPRHRQGFGGIILDRMG
jgi:hypothetical protein